MEVVPGVHLIAGLSQVYVYREAERLTLIDTGLFGAASRVLEEIESLGRKPEDLRQIIVTHSHADHTGALAQLVERTGAQVLAHALDAPVIRGDTPEPPPVFESDTERELGERVIPLVPKAPPAPVDRELQDGDEIDLDSGARVVHVPGHTAGSIAVYLPKRRMLFSGDAGERDLEDNVIVGVFNVDGAQARDSFRKMAALDFEIACFGHGRPMDKDASLAFRRLADTLP
jgi:glyoxylase-like metal-dependent hydrolase (beta-lactamase superfamily II)